MNDEELTRTIYEKINKALNIQKYEQKCLVRNFRLFKVILPSNVMRELERQQSVIDPNMDPVNGIRCSIVSIPVEEDKNATRIRYVIEGELELL